METSFEMIENENKQESQEVVQTKKCHKCGRELPLSAFSKNARNKDGLQCYCRECQSRINKILNDRKREILRNNSDMPKSADGKPMLKVFANPELARFTPRQLMEELKSRGFVWDYMLEPQRKIMFEKI